MILWYWILNRISQTYIDYHLSNNRTVYPQDVIRFLRRSDWTPCWFFSIITWKKTKIKKSSKESLIYLTLILRTKKKYNRRFFIIRCKEYFLRHCLDDDLEDTISKTDITSWGLSISEMDKYVPARPRCWAARTRATWRRRPDCGSPTSGN